MSTESNKALIVSLYNELQRGNFAAVDQMVSPDFLVPVPGNPQPVRAAEVLKQTFASYRKISPDFTTTITAQIAEGENVVTIYKANGTTAVPMMGRPRGQHVTMVGIDLFRIVNGKIVDYFGLTGPVQTR